MFPTVELGEILRVRNGFAFKSELFCEKSRGIPLVRIRDIKKGKTELNYDGVYRNEFLVSRGDMLIGMDGDFECVIWQGERALLNQRVCRLEGFSTDVLPSFVYYSIQSKLSEIHSTTAFVTVKHISSKQISDIKIPLPPLDQQQRIVDILDRAASIQRLRQAADEKLKQIIPALFVDMFGDPASNPKGLPLIKLGDLIERIETGKNVTAGSGTSDYSILKVSAVTSGTYKEHESKPAPDDHMIVYNHIVREGDFLFSRANTVDLVGATAIVHQTNGKTLLPDKLWRIRWHKDADPRYMLAVMQNKEIRAELGRASSGTSASMRNISQGRLASIEVPVASFEQQSQFGRISEALTAKAWLSQQASQHAQSAAASLTQSVFGN